ncbi:MAG: hypothetical protein AAB881_01420 [Patescibacteria group bacterium]
MKKTAIIITVITILALTASGVSAKNEKAEAAIAKTFAQRCQRVEERVQNRAGVIETREKAHMVVYNNMTSRILKFIAKAKTDDLDTTKVEADLAELKVKIAKFQTDYTAYQTTMTTLRTGVCSRSEGNFKTDLTASKTALKLVHDDAAAIRAYWRETVKVDLLALRDAAEGDEGVTTGNTTGN